MREVLSAVSTFFFYAVVAVFTQNAVLTRALGVSRLVKLTEDSTVDTVTFGLLLCCIQLISAPLAYGANLLLTGQPYRAYVRPLVLILCTGVAFFVVLLAAALFLRISGAKNVVAVLPMATFNTCVLGTLLISATQHFTFWQTMGFALGSGLGYLGAVLVVCEGSRKLEDADVPNALRGLPITLLYIGILSLALYGFTGHMIAF